MCFRKSKNKEETKKSPVARRKRLKDGKVVSFGRIESPYDVRDYDLEDFMCELPCSASFWTPQERMWEFPKESLDQEDTSHCVGYSGASWGISLPIFTPFENKDGERFYRECKQLEGNPNSESGAYVRSIAKVLKNNKHLKNYAFAQNIDDIRWWLLHKGPVIVGTIWTEGMMDPDDNNIIFPTGKNLGGHAYVLTEVTNDGYFGLQNSWGADWGDNGKAYIAINDFEEIFKKRGEAIAAVEVVVPPKKEWKIVEWFEKAINTIVNFFRNLFT